GALVPLSFHVRCGRFGPALRARPAVTRGAFVPQLGRERAQLLGQTHVLGQEHVCIVLGVVLRHPQLDAVLLEKYAVPVDARYRGLIARRGWLDLRVMNASLTPAVAEALIQALPEH